MRDGWTGVAVSSFLAHTIGGAWGEAQGESEIDVQVFRSTNFQTDGYLNAAGAAKRSIKKSAFPSRQLQKGDILLEKSGGGPNQPVGRVAYVREPPPNAICGNFIQLLRPRAGVDARWLFYLLWEAHLSGETLGFQAQTTGIRNLRTKDYLAREVALPPHVEQRRIADFLETLDAARDAAHREVVAARTSARTLRAHLLDAPGANKVPLRDLVQITIGRQRSPKHQVGDHIIPYLRAANVKDGFLVLDDVLSMNFTPAEQQKYSLERGDVLVTEGCGSLSQIGANAVWHEEIEGAVCFQNTLLRLRAVEGKTLPSLVAQWARFAFESGAFSKIASGTNIFHIGVERTGGMPFPSIELDRQAEIAEILDAAQGAVEAGEGRCDALDELRSSAVSALVSGAHAIPESYDHFLADVSPAAPSLDPATV